MESDAKKKARRIVPWFSMQEWSEVYKQIFSNDINLQRKGYEKLLVWKARSTALPAGVECTLSLIHVSLQDKEIWPQIVDGSLPLYREHDLRLMYSTSIMRFLNHISAVAQTELDTLYRMARKLNIPDWVVNIRHSAAHSNNLPSLNVLRSATHFTLNWIHEHYWKEEAVSAVDYFATEEVTNTDELTKQIQDYVEMWQVLKLYSLNGCVDVTDVPDPQLKSSLDEIISRLTKKSKKKASQILMSNIKSENNQANDKNLERKKYNTNISLILSQLLKHLEVFLSKNRAIVFKEDLLISTLLEGEIFFPGEDLLQVLSGECVEKTSVPLKLVKLSQDILKLFQKVDMLPKLLRKFVEVTIKTEEKEFRRKISAIWINEICRALIKAKAVKAYERKYDKGARKNNSKFIDKNIKSRRVKDHINDQVEQIHPNLKNSVSLKPAEAIITVELLKEILHSPNKWTSFFLPSLLDLVHPALPSAVKTNILYLVQTYMCDVIPPENNTECLEEHEIEIYTLDMLENNVNNDDANEENEMDVDLAHIDNAIGCADTSKILTSSWIQSEPYLEWENCPLGILPWQNAQSVLSHTFSCEAVWKTTNPDPFNSNTVPEFPVHLPETINWDNVRKRKRVKKKHLEKKRLNLIKNACAMIMA